MRLASLFSDHAVLQREQMIPVWGWTRPSTRVVIKFKDQNYEALSNTDGSFLVRMQAQSAGGPFVLEAETIDGSEKTSAKDIYIGEVWLASGQSNMGYSFEGSRYYDASQKDQFDCPMVRMINIPHEVHSGKQSDVEAVWKSCSFDNAKTFSAVATFFAKKINAELNVPIGVINSSWGGTRIEAWTKRETLAQNPQMSVELQLLDKSQYEPTSWKGLPISEWENPNLACQNQTESCFPKDLGIIHPEWIAPNFDDRDWEEITLPSTWQKAGHILPGTFYFRREVMIDSTWDGEDLVLNLGAADKHDITYFNGVEIGSTGKKVETQHWNVPRVYTIPKHLIKTGKNSLVCRVHSFVYDGGLIGPSQVMKITSADMDLSISISGVWRAKREHEYPAMIFSTVPHLPGNQNMACALYNNMIHPLIPYGIRGAIWYQGESNAGKSHLYARQMQDMVRNWRYEWGQGDFPFYIVQLANFKDPKNYEPESSWALLREAQNRITELPNTGVAVIIDIGEADDIHPKNKHDVGDRLAQYALHQTYGKSVVPCGPVYSKMVIEGSKIRLYFDHVGKGLVSKNGELSTFMMANLDGIFVEAEATIDGDTVLVSHPKLDHPTAVRYAWADNPKTCNLYNVDGFPASPFRTDRP